MMPVSPILEARDILKIYPNGVRANDGVSLAVTPGEIHAVIGENGAGKSTLMKILYGLERPTRGQIVVRGNPVSIDSPQTAIRLGIGMVHQHFMLIPSFTVAQNVVLNAEPTRGLRGLRGLHRLMVDQTKARATTQALAGQYGLPVDPDVPVSRVSVGMRQRVEILKALYRGADVFILDEPTAVLTPGETRDLFGAVRTLVSQGKTVIFITHKLREVKEIADRVTVMRAGRVIGTVANADERTLARMMIGREVFDSIEKPPSRPGKPVLTVRDLTWVSETGKIVLDRLSFEVCEGEILGIAGIEGNGQTELVEVLTGLRAVTGLIGGTAALDDQPILHRHGDPRRARETGIAHIPEDRLTNGSAASATIRENLIVDRYYKTPFQRRGLLQPRVITAHAQALIQRFGIMASGSETLLHALSGGNTQKVIVARELSSHPRLLIAAQPTRGVDVGATEFIHQQLIDKRSEGLAILLVSADLQEVISLSDRLLVMYDGRIVARFSDPAALPEDDLGLYMAGVKQDTGLS